jgi:ammonia channel protein AmtB
MDPEMAKYFKKILNSFSMALIWMMSASIAGFYFGLALYKDTLQWYNVVYYVCFLLSLVAILWYYYKLWR